MKEMNAVRSRLTYAQNHSRYEHHGGLVIFNDEICGNNEKQFELIGLIHQCATSHFEGFLPVLPADSRHKDRKDPWPGSTDTMGIRALRSHLSRNIYGVVRGRSMYL